MFGSSLSWLDYLLFASANRLWLFPLRRRASRTELNLNPDYKYINVVR